MKLYTYLAQCIGAKARCEAMGNEEWLVRWSERIQSMLELFPHGSGFDCGTKLDEARTTPDKLVFTTAFHHMNEGGMYDGWTSHTLTVVPSLQFGFHLKIGGRNRNDIKDYIGELVDSVLRTEVDNEGKAVR